MPDIDKIGCNMIETLLVISEKEKKMLYFILCLSHINLSVSFGLYQSIGLSKMQHLLRYNTQVDLGV